MRYSNSIKTLVLAAFFLTPFVSFACQTNADCSSPGQICLPSGQCGYAAGSSVANCYDTCSGSCIIDASGNATCSTQGGTTGSCPGGQTYSNGSCVYSSSSACPNGTYANGVCVGNSQNGLAPGTTANGGNILNGSPSTAGTSGGINPSYIQGYAVSIISIINSLLVPVLMAIAFLVFLWGVVNYFFFGADNDTKRAEGRTFVLWGIIGFAVIISLWGLVYVATSIFGLPIGGTAATYGIKPPTL